MNVACRTVFAWLPLLAACNSMPPEESVKPGINEDFLDPEMDVGQFVARFEGESREVSVNRERIVAAVAPRKGAAMADVGAGTGLFLDLFAEAVGAEGAVYALDIAPRFVEHLAARAERLGYTQVRAQPCSERSVELSSESVDLVFICDTYHHFEYPRSTMTSVYQALRPGGEVVIVDFERIPGVSREWILGHVRCGKEQVQLEMDSFGFDLVGEVDIAGLEENYFLRFRKR